MNEKRENEKDEAAYPWFLRTQDRVQYDRIITQRDQALAEVERLRAYLASLKDSGLEGRCVACGVDAGFPHKITCSLMGALADNTREASDG